MERVIEAYSWKSYKLILEDLGRMPEDMQGYVSGDVEAMLKGPGLARQ